MSNLDIHVLMKEFSALPNARVGHGPRHPEQPNIALREEIEVFLDKFSFLKQDQGYVDFLECYAGASSHMAGTTLEMVIDIFGFSKDLSSHLTQDIGDWGSVVDDDGYFGFAGGMIAMEEPRMTITAHLGAWFDATGNRKWGIYRTKPEVPDHTGTYWYCETFLEWLKMLVETEGELPDVLG